MSSINKIRYMGTDYDILKEELEAKAEIDGYYENMSVGNAEQLASTIFTEDQTPYLFRTTGGSADVGDREYVDAIVGATVAWNQLFPASHIASDSDYVRGTKITNNNNGTLTIDVNAVPSEKVERTFTTVLPDLLPNGLVGHKILQLDHSNSNYVTFSCSYKYGKPDGGNAIGMAVSTGYSVNIIVKPDCPAGTYTIKPQVIDLTQMFGSTIADYIYGLETANAGAGVAWFKKLFPKPYYEHDAGTLKSVEGVSAHKTIGFNAWDEQWEVGRYDTSTGNAFADTTRMRCKNPIPVIGGATYYTTKPITYLCYDADGNYTGQLQAQTRLRPQQFPALSGLSPV